MTLVTLALGNGRTHGMFMDTSVTDIRYPMFFLLLLYLYVCADTIPIRYQITSDIAMPSCCRPTRPRMLYH